MAIDRPLLPAPALEPLPPAPGAAADTPDDGGLVEDTADALAAFGHRLGEHAASAATTVVNALGRDVEIMCNGPLDFELRTDPVAHDRQIDALKTIGETVVNGLRFAALARSPFAAVTETAMQQAQGETTPIAAVQTYHAMKERGASTGETIGATAADAALEGGMLLLAARGLSLADAPMGGTLARPGPYAVQQVHPQARIADALPANARAPRLLGSGDAIASNGRPAPQLEASLPRTRGPLQRNAPAEVVETTAVETARVTTPVDAPASPRAPSPAYPMGPWFSTRSTPGTTPRVQTAVERTASDTPLFKMAEQSMNVDVHPLAQRAFIDAQRTRPSGASDASPPVQALQLAAAPSPGQGGPASGARPIAWMSPDRSDSDGPVGSASTRALPSARDAAARLHTLAQEEGIDLKALYLQLKDARRHPGRIAADPQQLQKVTGLIRKLERDPLRISMPPLAMNTLYRALDALGGSSFHRDRAVPLHHLMVDTGLSGQQIDDLLAARPDAPRWHDTAVEHPVHRDADVQQVLQAMQSDATPLHGLAVTRESADRVWTVAQRLNRHQMLLADMHLDRAATAMEPQIQSLADLGDRLEEALDPQPNRFTQSPVPEVQGLLKSAAAKGLSMAQIEWELAASSAPIPYDAVRMRAVHALRRECLAAFHASTPSDPHAIGDFENMLIDWQRRVETPPLPADVAPSIPRGGARAWLERREAYFAPEQAMPRPRLETRIQDAAARHYYEQRPNARQLREPQLRLAQEKLHRAFVSEPLEPMPPGERFDAVKARVLDRLDHHYVGTDVLPATFRAHLVEEGWCDWDTATAVIHSLVEDGHLSTRLPVASDALHAPLTVQRPPVPR